ncbi:MAG: cupredoxin domain-containing protein [Thermoplasmatota archaeon]
MVRTALLACLLVLAAPMTMAQDGHDDHAHGEDALAGPQQQPGEDWSHIFTEPGTFEYHCHPHPWMQATIIIEEAPEGYEPQEVVIEIEEPEDYQQWSFTPEQLTVRVGDTVTWRNTGAIMHKVAETGGEHADHIASMGGGSAGSQAGDGHDHVHDDGSQGNALFWIIVALAFGLIIAAIVRKGSP